MESRIGEIAALATALCWTITALSFESAGRRVGSLTVNITRLVPATFLFALYGIAFRGIAIPIDVPADAWRWLLLSGLVGFVLGDLFLFQAFIDIGARISMLIYASVPPMTTILGLIFLDEPLTLLGSVGTLLTVGGITLVVLRPAGPHRPDGVPGVAAVPPEPLPIGSGDPAAVEHHTGAACEAVAPAPAGDDGRAPRYRARGIIFAFMGALGQAAGLILGRIGAGRTLDAFAATQIRVIAALIGFSIVLTATRRWRRVAAAFSDTRALGWIGLGAVFGPFLGVSLGLFAAQNTSAGVASTLMALVPVLIIIPSVLLFEERVTPREVIGAVIAVGGASLLFW
ncbi:MAG: EamA family transporter [Spirochaetaceae bacterium]|nr:MAG: EamA family transporter [Spirochaetaceae bacterium]